MQCFFGTTEGEAGNNSFVVSEISVGGLAKPAGAVSGQTNVAECKCAMMIVQILEIRESAALS
jgi:hypothetical protein